MSVPFTSGRLPDVRQDAQLSIAPGNKTVAGLELTRRPPAAVRLIPGTTVSLLDRVAAGTLSEPLFPRLNIIHLMAGDGPQYVAGACVSPEVHINNRSTPKLPR